MPTDGSTPQDSGTPADGGMAQDSGTPDAGETGMDAGPGMDAEPNDGGGETVAVQLISISDWHGQLDPLSPTAPSTIAIGGAAVLSSYFQQERAANPNTIVVTAGDAFGGSPPLASFFAEEPAVLALNLMGLDVDTFGNHNFDRGIAHLQSMIDLATYAYVSSNLGNLSANLTGVASPYHLVETGGVRVAFVGITNDDAPTLTAPSAMGTLTVEQMAASAMFAQQAARDDGADVVVALVHLGGAPLGPLGSFATAVSGFDVIFGDHTDQQVNEVINGQRVVENRSKGRAYARVVLSVGNGQVTVDSSEIVTPFVNQVVPDPAVDAMLAPYRAQLSMQLDSPIAVATDVFPRGGNIERLGEVAIGNLVTDALRDTYGTQIAFVNGGGIRDRLPSNYLPADMALRRTAPGYAAGPPYDLVTGDAFAVFPFGNTALTRTVTGAQLYQVLEHGVSSMPSPNGRFLQISGFRFTYTASAAVGSRVLSAELDDGTPILRDTTVYTAATTDFINNGGDGYSMLADGTGTTRDLDATMLAQYLESQQTVTPAIAGRITRVFTVPGGCNTTPRAPQAGDLVINEILYDPGAANGDANNDGVISTTGDEFVEIVNVSMNVLDLSGVTVSDGFGVRHTYAAGTMLGCGDPTVVFASGDPTHAAWQASWVVASTGSLGLNNNGDTVTVRDASDVMLNEAATPSANIDQSIVRQTELDPTAAFINHSTHPQAGGALFSPGTRVDGSPF